MAPRVDHRQLARFVAVGRLAVGSALVVAPALAGRVWVGDHARHPATKVVLRALGIRDLVLGAGTLHALSTGAPVRPWVAAGGASDAVDAGATLLAVRQLPCCRSIPVLVVAVQSAALAALSLDHLD